MKRLNKSKKLMIALSCLLFSTLIFGTASAADDLSANNDAWAALGVGVAALVIFGIIIWLVIAILIAIWVYKDAQKRGESGALWLIIVILTSIIGLIIWLVVRPPIGGKKSESERRCPNCGRPIPMDARICPYCSKKFEE